MFEENSIQFQFFTFFAENITFGEIAEKFQRIFSTFAEILLSAKLPRNFSKIFPQENTE